MFVSSDITWNKLLGLVSARLNLDKSHASPSAVQDHPQVSHLSLFHENSNGEKVTTVIRNMKQFVKACESYSAQSLDAFIVHMDDECNELPLDTSSSDRTSTCSVSEVDDFSQSRLRSTSDVSIPNVSEVDINTTSSQDHSIPNKVIVVDTIDDGGRKVTDAPNTNESEENKTPDSYLSFRFFHPQTRSLCTLSISRDCDWEGLTAALGTASPSQDTEWLDLLQSGDWSMVLLDEDGDTISTQVNSMKKFWKYYAVQAKNEKESLAFTLCTSNSSTVNPATAIMQMDESPIGEPMNGLHRERKPLSERDSSRKISNNSHYDDKVYESPPRANAPLSLSQRKVTNTDEGKSKQTQSDRVVSACTDGNLHELQEVISEMPEDEIFRILCSTEFSSQGYTALHCAAQGSNVAMFKWLFSRHQEWNKSDILYEQDAEGLSPLYLLCAEGNVEVLRFLHDQAICGYIEPLRLGSVRLFDDTSVFHACVQNCQYETLTWLLQEYTFPEKRGNGTVDVIDVNVVNAAGTSPLHLACELSDIRMARSLVDHGACVNIPDRNGNTPLFVSCIRNDLIMVQWLYANGATYAQCNNEGCSVLHIASRMGHGNLARWLTTHGLGDYNERNDTTGLTPVNEAELNGHMNIRDMFLEMRNADEENEAHYSTFFSAVQECRTMDVMNLLNDTEMDLDVDCAFPEGDKALHVACSCGCFEMAELLVSRHGADVDARNRFTGLTPLHVACLQGQVVLAQWLVQRGGANSLIQCHRGNTALHYACQSGDVALVQWFLRVGSLDINASNIDGVTPLYFACLYGFLDIAVLLASCPEISLTKKTAFGETLLHAASEGGHEILVDWILREMHNLIGIEDQNLHGHTAFYLSCCRGYLGIAKILYAACPTVVFITANAVDDHNSVLHISCAHGHVDIVSWLVDEVFLDMDIYNVPNSSEKSPRQLAYDADKLHVVKWLDKFEETSENQPFVDKSRSEDVSEQLPCDDSNARMKATSNNSGNKSPKPKMLSSLFSCVPVQSWKQRNESKQAPHNITFSQRVEPIDAACKSSQELVAVKFSEEINGDASKICGKIRDNDIAYIKEFISTKSTEELSTIFSHIIREYNMSVLHFACHSQDPRILKAILSGAMHHDGQASGSFELNCIEPSSGNTPLHFLCEQFLLTDSEDVKGESILMLLGLGADISVENKDGVTALHLLCSSANKAASTVMRGIIELPRTVLPQLDLGIKNSEGLTLLHLAVLAPNESLVKLLCQYSPSLVNSRSELHLTPLHLAVMHGSYEIAQVLLDFEAYVNARDDDGMTALLFACRHGHLRLAKLLVKHGANLSVEEDTEGTALHMACRNGDFAMMKWLVRLGLRPDIENNGGVSASQLIQELLAESKATSLQMKDLSNDSIYDENDDDDDERAEAYSRMADWLVSWSLADKMGVTVEEVLAEVKKDKKWNV